MGTRHWLSMFLLGAFAAGSLFACGGSDKKSTASAQPIYEDEESEGEDDEDGLIPEEKFDEIKNTFERKATTVARCFPKAVESGEVDKTDRIKVTVSVEIQPDGSAKDMQILGSSKRSKTLEDCVLKSIGRWEFTTLPRPLIYSYGFVLQRL